VSGPGLVSRRRFDSDLAFSDLEYCQRRRAIPASKARVIGMRVRGWSQAGIWAGRRRGSSDGTVVGDDIRG